MAFQIINHSGAGDTSTGVPNFGDIVAQLAQGFEMGHKVRNMPRDTALRQTKEEEANKASILKNALEQEFGKREKQADIGYKEALTKNANNPFTHLTGIPAEYYGAQILSNQLGDEHPIVKQVKQGLQNKIDQQNSLMQYRNSLIETAAKRASTPLGKLELERQEIANDPYLTDEEKMSKLNRNRLAREKTVSDPGTRQKVAFATNIDKTLKSFNPEKLIQYSGIGGQVNLKADQARALKGKPPQRYREYEMALTSAKLLGKQIRQFYGDSIQPSVQEDIGYLVNPSNWFTSPDVALDKYHQLENVLLSETQTYKDLSPNLIDDNRSSDSNDDPLGIL